MSILHTHKNQSGIAHLGLIVLAVLVIGFGYFAYTRVSSANDSSNNVTTSSSSSTDDNDEADAKKLSDAESAVDETATQTNTKEAENVVQ